ncbi:hypothetical protein KG086_04675 [Lacticaseibacillus chiayiensis]|uniref:hypothetical protein n=1 Tax=Lacticaseibacillus chiayiensis TaxID=2100821 RepID=UPI001BD05FDB|nr:hypothetical protein [Lacticaseibacillus chiayiensis]QVI35598.1 hypothetical protein KG086_04675 [Lacticaseibacillus chiayiensis]
MNEQKRHIWENYLTRQWFAFGKKDEEPYTRDMILNSDGQISNYAAHNESFWQVCDDQLQFLDMNHEITTRFPLPENPSEMVKFTLIGDYVLDPSVQHQLMARQLPESLHDLKNGFGNQLDAHFDQASLTVTPLMKKIKTRSRVRVAFILNSVETLPALLPLMKALQEDEAFEVKILVMNKQYYDLNILPTLDDVTAFLQKQQLICIPVESNYEAALKKLRLWQADFIIRQSQWDGDYPSAFQADHLDWARLIHVPYTITEKMTYAPHHQKGTMLTNDYYLHVWRYYIAEPLYPDEKEAVAASFISQDIFQPVGSMKAKMIEHATPKWPINHPGKRVLWTAHHSVTDTWFKFGTFPRIYQAMLGWTRKHQELSVLFNPHPLLREIIATEPVSGVTLEQYDQFLKTFAALPNGGVLQHQSQYGASAAADAILTDGYSAFYEMQIQRKPIVALLRKNHTPFTPEGEEILHGLHVVHDIGHAQQELLRLLSEPDDKRAQQIVNTQNWLINEHPEQTILQAMLKEMRI